MNRVLGNRLIDTSSSFIIHHSSFIIQNMSNFTTKVKNIGREIPLFLTSKIFLKNFAGMVALIAGILALSFFWMNQYTHHGEHLQVPSYLNMNIV